MGQTGWLTVGLLLVAWLPGCNSSLPRPCHECQHVENRYGDIVDGIGLGSPISNPKRNACVNRVHDRCR